MIEAISSPVREAPPKRLDRTRRTWVWVTIQQLSRIVTTVIFDLKVYGVYNVPKPGGVLLVSNHQSYLDPVLLSIALDRTLSYMAKAELFKNKYFGWLIRRLNAFPVSQGEGDVSAIKESIARLQEGHLLNVFPEGARTEDGKIAPLQKGIALLIRRAKVPVIPVAITGSYEAYPKGAKYPRAHPIRILIGPPMQELWKLDRDEIVEKIDRTLRKMYDDVQAGKIPPNPPRPRGR